MNIKIGYYDWVNYGVKDGFYPDDMPKEWRLSFYANELEAVQLLLSSIHLETVDDLFEDLNEALSIVIDADDGQWPVLDYLVREYPDNISAITCSGRFQQQCTTLLAESPIMYFSKADKSDFTFQPNVSGANLFNDTLNLAYVDESLSLKEWRKFIELWVSDNKHEQYVLLLNPKAHKTTMAIELRMVAEMMGY